MDGFDVGDADCRSSIDYLLRTIQQSQVQFSHMADAKANSMFTVCSLVMSICITQLNHLEFRLPLIILVVFSALALTAAVVAVIPTLSGRFSPDGGKLEGLNPFYFANYPSFKQLDYLETMRETLSSDSILYETLLKDIYNQGFYLATKKYRWIRISYGLFIIGLFSSIGGLVYIALKL